MDMADAQCCVYLVEREKKKEKERQQQEQQTRDLGPLTTCSQLSLGRTRPASLITALCCCTREPLSVTTSDLKQNPSNDDDDDGEKKEQSIRMRLLYG